MGVGTAGRPGSSRPAGATSTQPGGIARAPSRPDVRPDEEPLPTGPHRPVAQSDEIDRALSGIDGRHQDTARHQRDTQAALAAKRAAAEQAEREAIAAEKRNTILKVLAAVILLPAIAGGGWYGFQRYQRKLSADAALAPLIAPYTSTGWKAFPRPIWRSRHRTEALVGANTCVIALASTSPGTGKMVVERPSGSTTAQTSLAFCTCADEKVVLHTEGNAPGGVQLLFDEAIAVGGSEALPFVTPRPNTLLTQTCPVDPLDAWLAAGNGAGAKVATPPTAAGLAPTLQTSLESNGWKLAASAPSEAPFAVVPGAADSCFLAMSTTSGEAVALRDTGGERPLKPAAGSSLAIGWCTHTARALTTWRTGTGSLVVYRNDAVDVGGTFGLREKAAAMALGDVPTWVPLTERPWDATQPLLMSGVPSADIALSTDSRTAGNARLVSLTLGAGHVTATPDELDRYLCQPALETNPTASLCVESTPLTWRASAGEMPGIARSPQPFWMDVMTQVEGRAGLMTEQKILTLSRKLAAQHYEPTARIGVTEERDGVEVVGQDGYDRVIVIGVLSTAPWVLPYSEGAPWTIDGEPHSIPIAAGERLHLVSRPTANVPPEVRRTVVFRHKRK